MRPRRKRSFLRLSLIAVAVVTVLAVAGVVAVAAVWKETGRTPDVPAVDLPDVSKLPGLPGGGDGGEAPPDAVCPPAEAECVVVTGRIVFVESVDPDGDGDLHVVLADRESITGPGVTAIDIPPELRPAEDPGIGDRISAAGPVQRGSHGQDQVHALDVSWGDPAA